MHLFIVVVLNWFSYAYPHPRGLHIAWLILLLQSNGCDTPFSCKQASLGQNFLSEITNDSVLNTKCRETIACQESIFCFTCKMLNVYFFTNVSSTETKHGDLDHTPIGFLYCIQNYYI